MFKICIEATEINKILKSCDDPSLITDIKIAEERMCAYKDIDQGEI